MTSEYTQEYTTAKHRAADFYAELLAMPLVADPAHVPTNEDIQQFCTVLNKMCGLGGGLLPYISRLLSEQYATACEDYNIHGQLNRSYPAYIIAKGSGAGLLLCGAPPKIISDHYGLAGRVFLKRVGGRYVGEPYRQPTSQEKKLPKKTAPASNTATTSAMRYPQYATGYNNKKQKEYASWTTTDPTKSVTINAAEDVEIHVRAKPPKVKTGMSLAAAKRYNEQQPATNFASKTVFGDLDDVQDLFNGSE